MYLYTYCMYLLIIPYPKEVPPKQSCTANEENTTPTTTDNFFINERQRIGHKTLRDDPIFLSSTRKRRVKQVFR